MRYDRQKAIENATQVFWQLGFQGSKMRDLQSSMDMRPGSIYAAFGSKEGLFTEVLEHYIQQSLTSIDKCVSNADNPMTGLKSFFQNEFVCEDRSLNNKPVCLLMKSVAELEQSNPELAEVAQKGMQAVIDKFTTTLNSAKKDTLLSENADSEQLARWLQMQMMGLRLYAKQHNSAEDVNALINTTFNHLKML